MGAVKAYEPVPWFWSDQYDSKLQIAGLNRGYDRIVRRADRGVSHWYFRGEALLAVDALDDARSYMVGKRLLERCHSPDPARIADPSVDLKTLLP